MVDLVKRYCCSHPLLVSSPNAVTGFVMFFMHFRSQKGDWGILIPDTPVFKNVEKFVVVIPTDAA